MKIGLLLASWNDVRYLSSCLESWIKYRETNPLLICCLDVCFAENGSGNSADGSIELLTKYKEENKIDFFQILPPGLKEHEARNVGLKYLLDAGVEVVVSIGSDEVFKFSEITQIFDYVKKEEFIAVFKIPYKNYTFSIKQYTLGFAPHRIWRVNYNGWKTNGFAWDDDQEYINKKGEKILDKNLPIKKIPIDPVCHYTWCDPERSIGKAKYQTSHFSGGAGCSFRVNKEGTNIEFNPEYYKKTGQTPPEIYEEVLKE